MNTNAQCQTNQNITDAYKKQLVKYLCQCIASEGSKIILFSIFFFKLQLFKEYLIALILLMLLRANGGGIHCKHYTSCFLLSFFMLSGNIILAITVSLSDFVVRIILVACMILGYLFVPVISNNRPPATQKLIQKCKRNTILIILSYLILTCIVPNNRFIYIGFWTITMHIYQLILAKFLRRRNT